MEGSTKIIVAVAGVAVIGAFTLLRSGSPAKSEPGTPASQINTAALQLATANAENAAQIVMNRDQITGATGIQALKTLQVLNASNNDLVSQLANTNASIENNRISSATARAIEDSRASVSKTVAQYQYKIAKKQASNSKLNTVLGSITGGLKIGASVLKDIF